MPDSPQRKYEVFLRVAARLQVLDNLQSQLDEIAAGVLEAHTFRRALISLLDDNWNVIQIGSAGVDEDDLKLIKSKPLLTPEERRNLLHDRYRIGESYFIPHEDQTAQEVLKDALPSRRLGTDFIDWHPDDLLVIPLKGRRGQVLGTLSVDDPFDGLRPTAASLRILELFAREAAVTIETSILRSRLEDTRAYLETLIESIPDAIITLNRDGTVKLFNKGAEKLSGYPRKEIIGQSVIPLYGSKDEAKQVMFGLRSLSDEEDAGKLAGQEITVRTKAGETIPVSLSASILRDGEGREIGTAGVCKDLRPIRRLEEKLLKAQKIAAVSDVATLFSHEVNNFLSSILSAVQLSQGFLRSADVRRIFRNAGLRKEVDKEEYRLRVIEEEANRIAQLTEKLQRLAKGKEYVTTSYVDGVSMLDLDRSVEEMTRNREIRVLIADDRIYIRRFLVEILEKEGFTVEEASDGQEVLDHIDQAETDFDLVISDIKMPRLNGYEVATGLMERKPDLPVILITAYGYDPSHSAVRAKQEPNVVGVLYKPFDLAKLKKAIHIALTRAEN